MGLFDNCVLACDIDGTLLIDGYINPRNIEKIEYFMSEGGKFSLSTGRSVGAISMVLAELKRVSPCIVANGCMIYDYQNEVSLFEAFVPEKDYRIAELICNSGINVGAEIHVGNKVYTINRTRQSDAHQRYEKLDTVMLSFEEVSKYKWNKAIYMFDSAEDREKIKVLLKDERTDCSFVDTAAVFDGEFRNYYEQVPSGVSKAAALKKLCEILGIKKGGVFAMGDYYNDLEMVKTADISAVPIDSPEDIKSFAQYITCSCKDGAVADFIDYLTMVLQK